MRATNLIAVSSASLLLFACSRQKAPGYRRAPVTRGPVSEVVSATGDVNALVTVNVGSQVSGVIQKLYVDFNSPVKKNQPLAELDPRLFKAALERADAALASARADQSKAKVQLGIDGRTLDRVKKLFDRGDASQADVDTATAAVESDQAALEGSGARVLQAQADRDTAAANLAFTHITSPIDGIVVSRNVDVGQTVAAAFQAPTLFTIANDLTKMQILANIDEADVGHVKAGMPAKFTVDAYPAKVFDGTIREVRQAPTTIQNVVTYAAVIDAPNPDRELRQGMTASVTITADHRDDALRVPNAALRFRPDEGGGFHGPRFGPFGGGGGGAQAKGPPPPKREPPPGPGRLGHVYEVQGGQPVEIPVRLGISDGKDTEVLAGLDEGDEVITAIEVGGAPGGGAAGGGGQRRGR